MTNLVVPFEITKSTTILEAQTINKTVAVYKVSDTLKTGRQTNLEDDLDLRLA